VEVKRHRRLRRLVPDAELLRRRAAGETLRALAADYGMAHTTLGRYFARAEVVRQLREAGQGERRAAATRRVAERRAERAIRRQAKEQAALARAQDLRSRNDELAERAVEAGGGIEAVIEATGLRTRENVLRAIDPTILVHAFDNDAASAAAGPPDRARLRRLVPDPELVRRRAAGETLRRLASDYGVAHTTLGRWFDRPEVARQLHQLQGRRPTLGPAKTPAVAETVELLTGSLL
jgi:lambda repressor-like predicted transcriptional regulator